MNGRKAKEFRRRAYGTVSLRVTRRYGSITGDNTIVAVAQRGFYQFFKQRYKALRRYGVYEQTTKMRFHAQIAFAKKLNKELANGDT